MSFEKTPHAPLHVLLGQFIPKQVEALALVVVRDFVREFLHQVVAQALVQGPAADADNLWPKQQHTALLLDVVQEVGEQLAPFGGVVTWVLGKAVHDIVDVLEIRVS